MRFDTHAPMPRFRVCPITPSILRTPACLGRAGPGRAGPSPTGAPRGPPALPIAAYPRDCVRPGPDVPLAGEMAWSCGFRPHYYGCETPPVVGHGTFQPGPVALGPRLTG